MVFISWSWLKTFTGERNLSLVMYSVRDLKLYSIFTPLPVQDTVYVIKLVDL